MLKPDERGRERVPAIGTTDWASLVTDHFGRLASIALLHSASPAEAEDLLQDVLCAVVADGVYAEDPLAYLARSIRNAAIDRARRRRALHRAIEARREIDGAAVECRTGGDVEGLLDAVDALPDAQREVLLLRTRGDLTFAQIAVALDLSPNTVASHHRRALASLRTPVTEEQPHADA